MERYKEHDQYDYIREMNNSDFLDYIDFIQVCNRETFHNIGGLLEEEIKRRHLGPDGHEIEEA